MLNSLVRKKIIHRLVLWALLIVGVYVLIRLAPTLSKPEYLPSDDFVQFWAGGKLDLQGENPYDPQKIEQLQIAAGGQASGTYTISIMLNPPWAIPLFMPFGMFDYPSSRLYWLIFSTLLLVISSQFLWRIYSGNPKQRWLALLVVFIFAPTISVLEVGQIAPLIIFGLTGFLYFATSRHDDWLAGIFIALASIKPQVALIFWIALLFWVIKQRRWLILISTATTILLLTLIAIVFNHHIIQQYLVMLQTYGISEWANPTIGAYLRFFWFGTDKFWLQFLPSLLGGLWFLYYWYVHNKSWNWVDELPIVLLVSQITSPYTWTYDQVILFPAIIQVAVWMLRGWKRWSTLILSIVFLGISALDLFLHMRLDDFWFIWLAPVLLIWFLIVRWQYSSQKTKLAIQFL
jgi:hypothetical protein